MKNYFILMAIIFGMIAPSASAQNTKKKVAVYMTGNDVDESYKKVIGAKLVSAITATNEYAAVERTADFLAALSSEQDYQASGEVRDSQIARLGQKFGVRYVVVADVSEVFDELFIASRMINVETGLVEKAFEANSPAKSMSQLIDLSSKVAKGLMGAENTQSSIVSGQPSGQDFVETTAGLNMKMVYVEGGDFLMGATSEQGSDAENDEQVIRRVKLDSYYIGECEVTQAQWMKVMGTSIQQQASKIGASYYPGIGSDYPMYYVNWEDAQAFCSELSKITGRTYCLPTEAQWEYAARGGKKSDGTKYSGSWSIDAVAWYKDNSGDSTHPVKNKRPNGLGLYDMSGNVYEWCLDWYGNSYNVNDVNNPVGSTSGEKRVVRGGSFVENAKANRVSWRWGKYNRPDQRFSNYGFRVVLLP